MFSRFAIAAALVLGTSAVSQARIILVPEDHATIQAGLDAGQPGDTVLVAPDTYSGPGNRNLDFRGKDMVLLADNETLPVILDCNGLGRGFWFHSRETTASVVDGFHVRNGVGVLDERGGGAILVVDAAPSIRNCVLEDCFAAERGGGVYVENLLGTNLRPTITGCWIRGNVAGGADLRGWGGGVAINGQGARVENCVISGNRTIDGNGSQSLGGGVFYETEAGEPDVLISGSTISGNYAGQDGALRIEGAAVIERCIIWGNCSSDGPITSRSTEQSYLLCCAFDATGLGTGFSGMGSQVTADPSFCDPAICDNAPTIGGLYYLQSTSPCTAENSPCGEQIGALGADCLVAGAMPALPPVGRAIWASPNPHRTTCELRLDVGLVVGEEAIIRDVQGRKLVKLPISESKTGKLVWDGTDDSGRSAPAGIYFASVQTRAGMQTARIIRVQ